MTKAELIDRIARSRDLPPDISKKLIGQILGIAFDELASYFARSRVTRSQSPRFTFPHFGTFTKKRRSARRGVNPRTLEPIQIEACNTVDFKVSRELREAMNPAKASGESKSDPASARGSSRSSGRSASGTATKATRKAGSKGSESTGKSRTSTASRPGRKKVSSKATRKTKKNKIRASAKRSTVVAGPGRRRLTPRDDEAELATQRPDGPLLPDESQPLPPSPMQRVKRRRTRSRGTG